MLLLSKFLRLSIKLFECCHSGVSNRWERKDWSAKMWQNTGGPITLLLVLVLSLVLYILSLSRLAKCRNSVEITYLLSVWCFGTVWWTLVFQSFRDWYKMRYFCLYTFLYFSASLTWPGPNWLWADLVPGPWEVSSSAVAERLRDASCLSVDLVSFNSTMRRTQSSVISYFRFGFAAAYK